MGTWLRLMLGVLWLAACETESRPPPAVWVDPETIPPEFECESTPNQRICNGHWSAQCDGSGRATDTVNCNLLDLQCAPGAGCRLCVPLAVGCTEDNEVYTCNAQGDAYEVSETCALGTVCNATVNGCIDLCAEAEQNRSYVGCDYWATVTSNSGLAPAFDFEIAVANPQAVNAQITVERGDAAPIIAELAPGEVKRIPLPWVDDLVNRDGAQTRLVPDGAYHITSSSPVTVTQFNPMEFQQRVGGTLVRSFTNDASLLLPSHILTGNYMVVSRAALAISNESGTDIGANPGFVAITAVDDNVEVEITSSAFTAASADNGVPALDPGQVLTLILARGEVLQLVTAAPTTCIPDSTPATDNQGNVVFYCEPDPLHDLTGTTLRATGRLAVIGGHDCAYVPFNATACDHLEEALFPEESWGMRVPVSVSAAIGVQRDLPDVVRVVSSHDDNAVTFTPAVHAPVTLRRGEYVDFVVDQDFVVEGTDALVVAQYLVGQFYGDQTATTGDPAMSLGIADAQWRNNYSFLTPDTYEHDFVNVIAPTGAPVTLDDVLLTGWTEIAGTSFASTRIAVSAGQHHMSAPATFGITVYGFASFTSYAYPGGLDLRVINGPD